MPTTVRSFCKVNLGLAVGGPRQDGFHGLATCYQTLELHDLVRISARLGSETRLSVQANHAGVPQTVSGDAEKNTAWKMVSTALSRLGVHADVEIRIEKRLPVQGGLGAGSANAAAALLGLERELGVALSGAERLRIAAEVGSDVPLFLLGGTVLGVGRGEEVYPLPDLPEVPCVVAVPAIGVSTARAFRELDARLAGATLTPASPGDRLEQLSRALAAVWTTTGVEEKAPARAGQPSPRKEPSPTGITCNAGDLAENSLLALVRTGMENDFEEVVFSEHPSLRSIKRDLLGSGPGSSGAGGSALYAALSGSGSALFGLYRTQTDAEAAQHRVQASGTRAIVTSTISRPRYWQTMFAGAQPEFAE